MRPPVPFGQYVAIDSPVHRLEARAKMALMVAFTVLLFASDSFVGLSVGAVVLVGAIRISHIPWRLPLRGIRALSFLLAFTLELFSEGF